MVTAAVGRYSDLSDTYLQRAHAYLNDGDLTQASEKGWGAAAVLVKACAESRGLNHDRHHQLWRAVNRLVDETGDRELQMLFSHVESLHGNYYEDYWDTTTVAAHLQQVDAFVEKVRPLIEPPADG